MPRKAIAAIAALACALAVAACGGGGDETGTSARTGEETQRSADADQVQRRAERIEEERLRQKEGGGQKGGGPKQGGGQNPGEAEDPPAPDPAPAPRVEHEDAGGGAAQFHRKGGDNSIQEFGQEGGGSELGSAAAVLHGYLDARAAGRWEDACSYLASQIVASIEQFASAYGGEEQPQGCPEVLQALSSGAGAAGLRAAARVDVGSLRVQGGRGFLLYHGPQGVDFAMPVALEAGEWKLAAPDATPLP